MAHGGSAILASLERYMKSGQAPQNPFEKIKDMAQEVDNPQKLGGNLDICSDSW